MTDEERVTLENEWLTLKEKMSKAQFVDPKDVRRVDEITSLLVTNGESGAVKFKFVKGRKVTTGSNNNKLYYRKGGKVG